MHNIDYLHYYDNVSHDKVLSSNLWSDCQATLNTIHHISHVPCSKLQGMPSRRAFNRPEVTKHCIIYNFISCISTVPRIPHDDCEAWHNAFHHSFMWPSNSIKRSTSCLTRAIFRNVFKAFIQNWMLCWYDWTRHVLNVIYDVWCCLMVRSKRSSRVTNLWNVLYPSDCFDICSTVII